MKNDFLAVKMLSPSKNSFLHTIYVIYLNKRFEVRFGEVASALCGQKFDESSWLIMTLSCYPIERGREGGRDGGREGGKDRRDKEKVKRGEGGESCYKACTVPPSTSCTIHTHSKALFKCLAIKRV